jgi:hypothetical protein
LSELTDRFAEAAGAVGIMNGHALAIAKFWACQQSILATGKSGPGC